MSRGLDLLESVEVLLLIILGHVWAQPKHWWGWNCSFSSASWSAPLDCSSTVPVSLKPLTSPPAVLHAATLAPFGSLYLLESILSIFTPGNNNSAGLDHLSHSSTLPWTGAVSRFVSISNCSFQLFSAQRISWTCCGLPVAWTPPNTWVSM